MEFLDKLVIPYSGGHTGLSYILLFIAAIIFISYNGLLFSSSLLSVVFSRIFKATKKEKYHSMAKEYADLGTSTIVIPFGLGIIPFLSIIFLYTQLLAGTGAQVVGFMIASFFIYVLALIMIFTYKHSLHLSNIFDYVSEDDVLKQKLAVNEEFIFYSKTSDALKSKTGFWGWGLIFLSMLIFFGAQTLAIHMELWTTTGGFFSMYTNWDTWFRFLSWATASFAIASGFFLFRLYLRQKEHGIQNEEFYRYSKNFNVALGVGFTLFQMFFFALSFISTPDNALGPWLFGIVILGIFSAFFFINLIYLVVRNNNLNYAKYAIYAVVLLFVFYSALDQTAFSVSNQYNAQALHAEYETKKAELLAASGIGNEVNGEEIYKAKCTACHAFDRKVVGPPHSSVLPKYMDNKQALVDFILNPVKVDPNYPPMPQQGLKPKEAEAVAEYMINELGKKLNQ